MATCSSDQVAKNQQSTLVDGLANLFQQKVLCDLILQAGSQQVQVHKCVLAASSPYFRAMFTLDTSENTQGVVKLQSVTGGVLSDIIEFIYTGRIHLDDSNIQAVVTAANMFQIETLITQCMGYMSSAICLENCLEVYTFADFHNLGSLKRNAESFLLRHFSHLCTLDHFQMLSLPCLTKVIKSDNLDVCSEELVYDSVMSWVKHDSETRKADLLLLILCIRFPLMTYDFIKTNVVSDPLIIENALCSHLIVQTLEMISSKSIEGVCSFSSKPRLGMFRKTVLVFSGGADSFANRSFTCYDPETRRNYYAIKHHPSFDFKFKIDFYRLVVTEKNEIFFIGGIFYDDHHFHNEGGLATSAVLVFDPDTSSWQTCPSMPSARCAFGACAYKGSLYVFGGYKRFPRCPPTDSALCYNVESEIWFNIEKMPEKMAHQAVCTFNDSAYLFGGKCEESQCLKIIFQYNFKSDQWTLLSAELPKPMADSTAIVNGDSIFILGGITSSGNATSVFQFKPNQTRSQWMHCEEFPEDRRFTSIVKSGDFIYVCGGIRQFIVRTGPLRRTRTVESNDMYKYDLRKNEWNKESRIIECGSNYTCCLATVNVKLLTEIDIYGDD